MDRLFEIGGRRGHLHLRGSPALESWHYRPAVIDWSGIFHILATPFTDEGPRLVETALATRVSGITVRLVAGHVPVVAGAGRRIPG